MVSPDYIDRNGLAHWKENSIPNSSDKLMQFTGLLDKNGKEIYEGDITENYAMRDVVIFHNGAFVGKNSQKDHLGQHQPIAVHNELEVIGNIYENPEMLDD